jgi:small-conductance mechanosensitive channel
VILVRFLLYLALSTIVVAALLYLFKKDRRYLRFIGQVVKYTIYLLAGVMVFYVFERLLLMA